MELYWVIIIIQVSQNMKANIKMENYILKDSIIKKGIQPMKFFMKTVIKKSRLKKNIIIIKLNMKAKLYMAY